MAILGWKVSGAVAKIFEFLFGQGTFGLTKKIGLTLAIEGSFWTIDASNKLRNGEITKESTLEAIAGAVGLGVGTGMLTASAPLGLAVVIGTIDWQLAAAGQGQAPDWLKYLFGHQEKGYRDAFFSKYLGSTQMTPISLTTYLSISIVNIGENLFPGLKKLLVKSLLAELKKVAKEIKKIPVIGTAIGTAIENGIKSAEKNIEKTTEKTTIKAIENATPEIEDSANETGDKATSSYISGMKERFDLSRDDLTKKIEETMNKSSTNADRTFKQTGDNNGTTYTKELNSKVSNNQPSLTGFIQGLISMAGNTAKRMFETKGKDNATDYNSQLNNNISGNQSSLTTTIKNTISNASTNAEATARQSGLSLGNKEMTEVSSGIRNSQDNLRNNITTTIRNANNSVDTSSGQNVGNSVGENIKTGFNRANLGYYMRRTGSNLGSELGDNISDNMRVNSYTLGTSLNNTLSSVISRIKNNNWSLFGAGGVLSNLLKFNWTFFADGGFPKEGDFFFANEAGPELVGTMNNHPAVANNDQIVKGIQSGVFSAMMSALDNTDFGGSNVTIEATGDTEGLLNFIEFKQKQKSRQFN